MANKLNPSEFKIMNRTNKRVRIIQENLELTIDFFLHLEVLIIEWSINSLKYLLSPTMFQVFYYILMKQ